MRAKEFVVETQKKLRSSARSALPNAEYYDIDPYSAYRLGVALAGAPDGPDYNNEGPTSGRMTTLPYSDGDKQILDAAKKKMGVTSATNKITDGNGSQELSDVNTQSPMTPKGPVKRKNK